MSAWDHNAAILPCLRVILDSTKDEAEQWVLLESLCLGIGKLHGRTVPQIAVFVETIAERLAAGERE